MWEWRIFYKNQDITLSSILKEYSVQISELLKKAKLGKRADYYWDINYPQYGVKERWESKDEVDRPKIELKVRYETNKNTSSESWEKEISILISENINKDKGLSPEVLINYMNSEQSNKMDQALKTAIQNVVNRIPNGKRVEVSKERRQIRARLNNNKWEFVKNDWELAPAENSNVVILEETNLPRINYNKSDYFGYNTICIEGSNLSALDSMRASFNLDNMELMVMSYPEFVSQLLENRNA